MAKGHPILLFAITAFASPNFPETKRIENTPLKPDHTAGWLSVVTPAFLTCSLTGKNDSWKQGRVQAFCVVAEAVSLRAFLSELKADNYLFCMGLHEAQGLHQIEADNRPIAAVTAGLRLKQAGQCGHVAMAARPNFLARICLVKSGVLTTAEIPQPLPASQPGAKTAAIQAGMEKARAWSGRDFRGAHSRRSVNVDFTKTARSIASANQFNSCDPIQLEPHWKKLRKTEPKRLGDDFAKPKTVLV